MEGRVLGCQQEASKLTFTDRTVEYIEDVPAKSIIGIKLTNLIGDEVLPFLHPL